MEKWQKKTIDHRLYLWDWNNGSLGIPEYQTGRQIYGNHGWQDQKPR